MSPANHARVDDGMGPGLAATPLPEPSPEHLLAAVNAWVPWLAFVALLLCAAGLLLGFRNAPPSHPGSLYRMIFIHAPAAWASLTLFALVAALAGLGLLSRRRLPAMLAESIAPTGAMFALIAFWTGSLWGRQSWRTWWDMHLALELVLLLLFVAIILFRAAIDDGRLADRVTAAVALAGLACIPVILGSWAHWPTLHRFLKESQVDPAAMDLAFAALAMTTCGFCLYAAAVGLRRLRCVILERDRQSDWVERHTGGLK